MITIKRKVVGICDLIILWALTLLVFLIPLFFLPFNPRVMEFSKQLLLYLVILVGYLAWFGKGIINKRLIIRRTPLDIPILAFLIIYLLSTLFSVDRITSVLGAYGQGSTGLITVIFYALLYFVLVNNINQIKKVTQLSLALLFSLLVVIVYVFLQIFNIFVLPFNFTRINSFNPIGSISNLTSFLAFVLTIAVGFLLKTKMKIICRILILILILGNLLLLNTINFSIGWYLLILSMFIILGFGLAANKNRLAKKWLAVPGALLVIAIFAATLGIPPALRGNLPSEVSLSRGLSWEIARKTVWGGFFKFLFGSGPETFSYDFSRYRPASFNQNILWNVRFDKANNSYLESLATTGSLGILAYTVIILISLGSCSLILVEGRRKESFSLESTEKEVGEVGGVGEVGMKEPYRFPYLKFRKKKQTLTVPPKAKKEPPPEQKIEVSPPQEKPPLPKTSEERINLKKMKGPYRSPQGVVDLKSQRPVREEEEEEEEEEILESQPGSYSVILGVTASWAALLLTYFLNPNNTTIQVLFWLSLALIMSLIIICRPQEFKKSKISFAASPKYALLLSFTFVIALSAVTILFTFLGRIYLADIYHQKGLERNLGQKYDEATAFFIRAIRLNKYRPIYYLALAQNYLTQANLEATRSAEADIDKIRILIANSINESKKATDMVSENVNFWEARAQIYENTTIYSNNANEWVIKSYEKARELESTNPVFETKLGRAYLTSATLAEGEEQQGYFTLALEALKKATELKQDYLAAHYYLALIYEKKEQIKEALSEIGICYQIAPRNQEVIYELGRLSYNKAIGESPNNLKDNLDFNLAIEAFKLVISLNPDHANSHYSLGLAYETLGETQKALEEIKIVEKLNPDNEQVKEKVRDLESKIAGRSTKATPKPAPELTEEPPAEKIEEAPKE